MQALAHRSIALQSPLCTVTMNRSVQKQWTSADPSRRVGSPGDQVHEVLVLVEARALREPLGRRRPNGWKPKWGCSSSRTCRRVRDRRGRARRSPCRLAPPGRSRSSPAHRCHPGAASPGARVDSPRGTPPEVDASPGRRRGSQTKRAGSSAAGSGGSSPGGSVPATRCARRRAEYGPCKSPFAPCPVATHALAHPGMRPTRAWSSAEVGRSPTRVSGGRPRPGREQPRGTRAKLEQTGRGHVGRKPAADSKVPPQATRPPGHGTR